MTRSQPALQGEYVVRKFMDVEGRRLYGFEKNYFENAYSLSCIVHGFDVKFFKDDEKVRRAFRRVVKTSPILQATVVGDTAESCQFSKHKEEEDWPVIRIRDVSTDDQISKHATESREIEMQYICRGGKEARLSSARIWIVRGVSRVSVCLVCPHHFADGAGLSVILTKLYLYCRTPKIFWVLFDRLSHDEVPTFEEMALKQDLPRLQGADLERLRAEGPWGRPNVFTFQDYDMIQPDAVSKMSSLNEELKPVPAAAMKRCRTQLRKQGLTITTCFQALAIKTMALLVDATKMNSDNRDYIGITPVDCRKLGKWGLLRRDRKGTFPVVGNYSAALSTTVPAETALSSSLEDIAKIFKKDLDGIRNDVDARIRFLATNLSIDAAYLTGVSSGIAPFKGIAFPSSGRIESLISFGPMPHVWFYVVTCGSTTRITVDIALPLAKKLDSHKFHQFIKSASKGSVLEPILNSGFFTPNKTPVL